MATDAHGFCMKCKTYVPIKDPVEMLMRNGRTRVAGYCSAQKDEETIKMSVNFQGSIEDLKFQTKKYEIGRAHV